MTLHGRFRWRAITVAALLIRACVHAVPVASAQQQRGAMPPGASWLAQDLSFISSPARFFCFGWLRFPTNSQNFYVAIWYAALDGTVVWVANRDQPAAASDTLQLSPSGNLLLTSASLSTPIWQTNTASRQISSLQILDSGNAVLLLTNGSYSWQSFSLPSDTLLPSQSFLVNSILISRPPASSTSLASGNFKFYISDTGFASIGYFSTVTGQSIRTVWQAPNAVFVPVDALTISGIAALFLKNGIFCMYNISNGSAYSQFFPSDYGTVSSLLSTSSIFRRLTLDPDGNLRMYSWDYLSKSWIVLSSAVSRYCSNMAFGGIPACGSYGVCVDAPKPACACPPGFHPININDVSKGCSPVNLSLAGCQNDQSSIDSSAIVYLMLPNTDYMKNDILEKQAISISKCQFLCTSLCFCVGVIYDNGGGATCWLKSSLTNGYSSQVQPGNRDAYIKLQYSPNLPVANPPIQSSTLAWTASSEFWSQATVNSNTYTFCSPSILTCPQSIWKSENYITKHLALVIILVVPLGEFFFFCLLMALLFLRKSKILRRYRKASPTEHAVCRAFTYAELVDATDHFGHELGSGAFGQVFKGRLSDGTQIAVKRLKTNALHIADAQFRAEIATLGRIHHANLLRLHGFCAESAHHRLLVYEFMENGSLNNVLFKEGGEEMVQQGATREGINVSQGTLDWKARYSICLGTARGLAYLHEDCLECIMHCDIKPENILLDSAFCPTVADFGLAFLFGRNEVVQISHWRGTKGYLAPEWLKHTKPKTAKADVYSYGRVVIEILSGRRNYRFTSSAEATGKSDYPQWAFEQVQNGHLETVLDQSIRTEVEANNDDYQQVEKVLRVAFLCSYWEADARPCMKSIVQMLEGSILVPDVDGSLLVPNVVYTALTDSDDDEYTGEPQGPYFEDGLSATCCSNMQAFSVVCEESCNTKV